MFTLLHSIVIALTSASVLAFFYILSLFHQLHRQRLNLDLLPAELSTMAQPTYQLIKAQLSARFDQQYKGKTRDCIPVFIQPSDISEWAKAPGWAKMAGEGKDAEDLTIGRQMGEKVELFEVPHMDVRMLRKGMEDQELKVSLYKPEEVSTNLQRMK